MLANVQSGAQQYLHLWYFVTRCRNRFPNMAASLSPYSDIFRCDPGFEVQAADSCLGTWRHWLASLSFPHGGGYPERVPQG